MEKITESIYTLRMTKKEVNILLYISKNFIENYEGDENSTKELDFCEEFCELFYSEDESEED